MKSCRYCAQTDTYKDEHGFCKKYNCFEISGTDIKFEIWKQQLVDANSLPKLKRNQFDGTYYNPRQIEKEWIFKQIEKEFGYVPFEIL